MQISTLKAAHAPQLLDLWNRSAEYDPLSRQLLHEKIWGDPDYDQALALLASQDGLPVAFSMGVVRQINNQTRGYIKLLAVDPQNRRQRLARQLTLKLHAIFASRQATTARPAESAPNYLFPGVDIRYKAACQFFESLGYTKVGEATNLTAPLEGQNLSRHGSEANDETKRYETKGIGIRRATATDKPSLEALLQAHWPTWNHEVATAMSSDPCAVHLALQGKQVVGFSAHDGNNRGTGWFGPMGTHPDYRGLGIGKQLLRRSLADIQTQGHAQAIIPWVSPTGLYRNEVGATVDRVFNRYELSLT